jgi:hypothetical protein
MIYVCQYTWNPGTTDEQVQQRIAAARMPENLTVRGYYPLVGGGAGYVIVETDEPQRVRELLVQSMDLIRWDVRAVTEGDLQQEVEAAKQRAS